MVNIHPGCSRHVLRQQWIDVFKNNPVELRGIVKMMNASTNQDWYDIEYGCTMFERSNSRQWRPVAKKTHIARKRKATK